jgi:chemotaxis protein MotB
MADEARPIIIKKIKKGGHGHHGGAWKVAYADFVTAMMAFFLLMWLLASTSESQREGIAEYFSPTIGLRDEMGIGFEGGIKGEVEGTAHQDLSPVGIVMNNPQTGSVTTTPEKVSQKDTHESNELFEAEQQMKKNKELAKFENNIIIKQTPEGLKIEVLDLDKEPMFMGKTAELTSFGREMISTVYDVIRGLPNHISITGHTNSFPANLQSTNYTNWELSAERANSARRHLLSVNMEPTRLLRIIGKADQELLEDAKEDPKSDRHRRIVILLLKDSHLSASEWQTSAPRDILSVNKGEGVDKTRFDENRLKEDSEPVAPVVKEKANPKKPVFKSIINNDITTIPGR